jgi:hypothetical protein
MVKTEKFNYVIARPWHPDGSSNSLCCYSYGSTVFHGTIEEAIRTRDFIRGRDDEHSGEYEIYEINSEFIKVIE